MLTCVERLCQISTPSLCGIRPAGQPLPDSIPRDLAELVSRRNGFYAFESALHVFPHGSGHEVMTFERWNALDGWRRDYGSGAEDLSFFAEDIFGDQFAIAPNGIVSFRSETGEVEKIADTVEEWACLILTDYEFLTGYPVAHDWQEKFGVLKPSQRLSPKVPFVLGGTYDISNMYVAEAETAMAFKADLSRQIRDLRDGTRVKIEFKR
jgi:hypothetical protein